MICTRCKSEASEKDFYFDKRRGTYRRTCRECDRKTIKLSNNKWKKANPEKVKIFGLKTKLKILYGISPEQLIAMWENQNSLCAICDKSILLDTSDKSKKAHIDHCHVSGVVRGLLCLTCNTGIGMLNDSIDLLDAAKNYLQLRGASTIKSISVPASVSADNQSHSVVH